jgi:hypothetical protein
MILGLIVFVLMFLLITPQSQTYLGGLAAATSVWLADWAPFSYILLLILLAAPVVGIHLVRTWPARVEEENPMARYRKEMPLDED